jgi:hypothetical protein
MMARRREKPYTVYAIHNPRRRDLPEDERERFHDFCRGRQCPVDDPAVPNEEWDWFYQVDYDEWLLRGKP